MKSEGLWHPDAIKRPGRNSGTMQGSGHRIMTLHDPGARSSASGVVSWVLSQNIEYTAVLDDVNKKFYQIFPFDRGARSMGNHGVNGGWGNNKTGKCNIQICLVTDGFTRYGSENAAQHLSDWAMDILIEIAKAWDIPLKVGNKKMSESEFIKFSGITYHSRGPYETHTDVGYIPENFFVNYDAKKNKKYKVTAKRKNGKVQLVHKKKNGRFTFNKTKGKTRLTKEEAKAAKDWAKKKGCTEVHMTAGKYPFVIVEDKSKKPGPKAMARKNKRGKAQERYIYVG